jgi:hypothetical protein
MVLYDLPEIVAGAPVVLRAHGVGDRCQAVGGDMFTSVPRDGDAYLLKSVLVDHDDAKVKTILRVCRTAMKVSGRLIVIERMTEPNRREVNLVDTTMLVMTGGCKRTLAEFTERLCQVCVLGTSNRCIMGRHCQGIETSSPTRFPARIV